MMCYLPVPPLEGFVMNRVQGDYFETLLYKIFVSIDEQTNVSELANVLEIDLGLVKVCNTVILSIVTYRSHWILLGPI
ncbi:unnamed protein product [Oncorhynchus mykiss]|uniref:FAM91 N-terminal domain-containing protein n=1 Tax=Oncorhynchus mykiss TaxID=8022 RepID=A0A060ZAJ2_ONCMY|nr:unnamed protein product [Oncorhynchus mykiss]